MTRTPSTRRLAPEASAAAFKALADPTRVRLVQFLQASDGEVTGTELAEHAGISLALLCHHGSVLVEGGLVTKRKVGQTSYWLLERGALDAAMRSVGSGAG